MRKVLLCGAAVALLGCGTQTSYVKSDTTLGRVVVYRNGVAYFERYADVQGDSLRLNVPRDKVDDFLKSLTVVDAATGEPAPITYPSDGGGGTIDMKVGVTRSGAAGPRKLRLSYVTEAPSWKPSYRVVLGKNGKLDLQGWAIIDNTSGEDWKDVRLGVGASSAMSFRFDLKGLRLVQRETLHENDLFAQAPPIGGSAYGGQLAQGGPHRVLADVSDETLRDAEGGEDGNKLAEEQYAFSTAGSAKGSRGAGGRGASASNDRRNPANGPAAPSAEPVKRPQGTVTEAAPKSGAKDSVKQMADALRASQNVFVVEGYAAPSDKDGMVASLDRANRLRNQLVQNGVDPSKIVARGAGQQEGRNGGVRVVEAATGAVHDGKKKEREETAAATAPSNGAPRADGGGDPIGTSHFESTSAMSVPRGTSAMVSILRSPTDGEVVYLYDPESPRGNTQFPFRTLRFQNPTDNALESGPVSVFGDGRFIGEGMAEPIPARSVAFVPFALDRQIVVERRDAERDEIAKIITVQRGVFSTQIQHTRRATFTVYNRLPERATLYLRHTVAQGYKLTSSPTPTHDPASKDSAEHLAGARLFRVELEPNGKKDVVVEEATPVFRFIDIRTPDGMDLVRAYLSGAAIDGALKGQVEQLLKLHAEIAKSEQHIQTTHEEMAEYRQRMDELHNQIFTLKAVKTAGPLMAHLEKKLQEVSEKLSKATIDVVTEKEKQMLARVQFQTAVSELSLEGKEPSATATR